MARRRRGWPRRSRISSKASERHRCNFEVEKKDKRHEKKERGRGKKERKKRASSTTTDSREVSGATSCLREKEEGRIKEK